MAKPNKKQKTDPIPQQDDDEEDYPSSEQEAEEAAADITSSEEEEEDDKQIADTKTKLSEKCSILKIREISENPERNISPIVGYFSSGYNPLSAGSSATVYKSAKSRNRANPRMELVVGTNNPQLNFVGTNYSGEATAPQLCNYALGVLDKETGVMKMVPIAANRVFRLMPRLPGMAEDEEPTEQAVIDHEKQHEFSAKKDITRDKKKVTLLQSETAGDRKGFVMKLGGATNAEALASTTDASFFHAQNLPPHNLEATTPDMAYPVDKIIDKGEWDCLLDIYELVQSGSKPKPDDYPVFVRNRISKLEDLKDESQRKRKASVLSYMTHLIKFRDKHLMDHFKTAKYHKFPSRLMQRFTSMFDASHERRIPDNKLVLLINYIVVLSLIVDDFSSDPTDIAKDLHMKVTDIRTHYGYLGCKMKGTCSTLPLPLKLRTVARNRKRK